MTIEIDVDHQINATTRTLGTRSHAAGELREVVLSVAYAATVDDLWDAVSTAERIARWFLPVSGDLRLGGTYQLEGNAGGEITACDPPHGFDATWVIQMPDVPEPAVSWIEVRVTEEAPARARLTLTHVAEVDDTTWAQFGPGAVGIGWDQGLLGLALHIASGGERVDPVAVMTWMTSDEGTRFSTLAGEGWYAAEVAAGDDPEAARRHADACIAAYTSWDPTAVPE
jgi:uncharacterized protein YndB with AHSA1/START domain